MLLNKLHVCAAMLSRRRRTLAHLYEPEASKQKRLARERVWKHRAEALPYREERGKNDDPKPYSFLTGWLGVGTRESERAARSVLHPGAHSAETLNPKP